MWCVQKTRSDLGFQNTATVEHVIPISDGGSNSITNLGSACHRCNQERGTTCAELFAIQAQQFEPDRRHQVEAANSRLKEIRKKILDGEIPCPPPQPAKLREREDKQAARQAYVINPHTNPFDPQSRCWRMFEKLVESGGDWWTNKNPQPQKDAACKQLGWIKTVLARLRVWFEHVKLTKNQLSP
jgi:hypothetical protein